MDGITTTLDAVCLASQMILESGGETYRAEETVERMCQGLRVPQVDVLALPTGLMLTLTAGDDSTYTRIVRVRDRSTNLERIDQCNAISRRVASGQMSAEEALKELRRVHQPKKECRLLLIGASALSAGSFTMMLGGAWMDFIVSFFCGALVQMVLPPLAKMRVPTLISSLLAGALTTLMALLGTLAVSEVHVEPVISGAIMPLLPGLATTNAMRDTMRGDLVSGGARIIEAILGVVMLAAGIGLMLSMWGQINAEHVESAAVSWWVLASCLVASASFSVLLHQPGKSILVSCLIAVAGYAVFLLLGQGTTAYFLATLLIGMLCEISARLLKRTATLFVTGGIIPLVPGVGLYNTMRHVVEGSYHEAVTVGVSTVLGLCAIALAITASSVIFSAMGPRRGRREKPC